MTSLRDQIARIVGITEATPASYEIADRVLEVLPGAVESGWRPIETAPKDGSLVDLWVGGHRVPDCHWTGVIWYSPHWKYDCGAEIDPARGDPDPTHWMPLPDPPTLAEEAS